jgi:ABC-type multidrug transport system fused ATPase/permease subunit
MRDECFDPALAAFPTRRVPIDAVVDLLHVSHAPERIAAYRRAMEGGQRFPPISVVQVAGRLLIADGHKRFSAYRSLGVTDIVVEVWTLRRWVRDQCGQFLRKSRQQWTLLWRSVHDRRARAQATRLFWDTIGHWRRVGLSLVGRRRAVGMGAATVSASQLAAPASLSGTQIFQRLVRECSSSPMRLTVALISLLGVAVGQLYLTWLVKLWAEGPVLRGDRAMLDGILTRGAVLNSINQRMVERLRAALHAHLLAVGVMEVRQRPNGEWLSRVFNDAGALSGFVRDVLKRLVGEGVVLVGALAMMFYLQWRLALIGCLLVPLVGVLLSRLGDVIRRRGAASQRKAGELSATLSEQLRGLTTIKGFQMESGEHERFVRQNARYRREVLRSEWWTAVLMTMVWFVTGIGLLAILRYGTLQVLGAASTPGQLFAFVLYAVQTVEPLRRLSEVQAMLQRALAAAARVFEVIDAPHGEPQGTLQLPTPARGDLRLEEICFRYRADKPVLDGLALRIAPRETVALVAASGGGKSTLASLLLRVIDPQRGRILMDGLDIRAVRLADLRRAVCVVEQDPFTFSGPLIENIRYGSPHASAATIDAAVARAGLEPMVRALPGGLHASLQEAGGDLSGGQKQRIALARAIVRDPSLLVLDEATSALDSDAEAQIFTGLADWLRRRTVLVMAHRLATVARFERIVVLQAGHVVGDGSVAHLLQSCPAFGELFAEQLTLLGWPRAAAVGVA